MTTPAERLPAPPAPPAPHPVAGAGLLVRGARVMDAAGAFAPADVEVRAGLVVAVHPAGGAASAPGVTVVDATGLWLMPGVVDCHTHLGWTTFLHDDAAGSGTDPEAAARAAAERRAAVARSLEVTLRAGVTAARDAGGADAALRAAVGDGTLPGPRLAVAVEMIQADEAGDVDRLRARVRDLVARGADWIKVVATGGVTAPAGTDLDSAFTAEELRAVVEEAASLDRRVMVHAWGGPAVTFAIEAGVASIEHGMFLTTEQAVAGAARGVVLVPTLTIYAEVAQMAARGELPEHVRARAERVVAAHPLAVRRAHEAGMTIALGSDFGTSDQHGRNLVEIEALARAGLGRSGALLAATRAGAELLGLRSGLLEAGRPFDALLLARDPHEDGVFARGGTVVGVYRGGERVS